MIMFCFYYTTIAQHNFCNEFTTDTLLFSQVFCLTKIRKCFLKYEKGGAPRLFTETSWKCSETSPGIKLNYCKIYALLNTFVCIVCANRIIKRTEQGNIKGGVQLGSRRRWKDALYAIWDNWQLVIRIRQVLRVWRPIIGWLSVSRSH